MNTLPKCLFILALTAILTSNSQATPPFQGHVQPYQPALELLSPPPIPFIDEQGRPRLLAEYVGQAVLVNLWASWCSTCLSEMASLQRLQQQLGESATLLTLNQDLTDSDQVRHVLERLGAVELPAFLDIDGRLGAALGQTLLPTTLLIDSQGRIVGQLVGSADWDSPAAMALINSLHL